MNGSLLFVTSLTGVVVFCGVYAAGRMFAAWFASYESQYVERAERDLYGLFSNFSPQRVLQVSMGCFAVAFGINLLIASSFETVSRSFFSVLGASLAGLLASLLPRWALKRFSVLRVRKFDLQLLDALTSMSNALKAGFSILQAFESIVQEAKNPIAQEFDLFLREVRLGVKFETASENLHRRVPSEDLQIVLAGIETARLTGGNLTEVFDRLAVVIRERMRIQGRIQSLTAQGRMQGWVVGLMPLILGFVIYLIQPGMILAFLQSTTGVLLIGVMLFLEAIGFFLIRKIVTIDV